MVLHDADAVRASGTAGTVTPQALLLLLRLQD
jgi:hypothetical protein